MRKITVGEKEIIKHTDANENLIINREELVRLVEEFLQNTIYK